jgi:hypothetical protein
MNFCSRKKPHEAVARVDLRCDLIEPRCFVVPSPIEVQASFLALSRLG